MRRITASEARRRWFQLLDEVLAGEPVIIVRKGQRIVIRRENPRGRVREAAPDYRAILDVPAADQADTWSWVWSGSQADLETTDE